MRQIDNMNTSKSKAGNQSSTLDAIRQDSQFCCDHLHNTLAESKACKSAENKRRRLRKPKIQTSPIFPPIPIRGLDWCAHFDNYEPGQPIGHGATEQEAIEDLKEQVEK